MNRMTVSVIATLLLCSAASSECVDIIFVERTDFTHVVNGDAVQAEYDTGQYSVYRLVAVFSNRFDRVIGVVGTLDDPVAVSTCIEAPVFQGPDEPNGWYRPGESANVLNPSNEFDTYVRIDEVDMPLLAGQADSNFPDYAGPFDAGLQITDGGWLSPSSQIVLAGDDLTVDIGQVTVQGPGYPSITGLLNYRDADAEEIQYAQFSLEGPCPGDPALYDLNGDNAVDVFDLLVLLQQWGTNGPGANLDFPLNMVDAFDLIALLENWSV